MKRTTGFTPIVPHAARKGFTLIELLVVVAIISLLVSILLPSLSAAKDMAAEVICQTHQKGMYTGHMFYAGDQNDLIPPTYSPVDGLPWTARITRSGHFEGFDSTDYGFAHFSGFHDPADYPSLGICPSDPGAVFARNECAHGPSGRQPRTFEEYVYPGETIFMGDAVGYVIGCWNTWFWSPSPLPAIYGGLYARHRDGATFLMDDGHVEWRSQQEYFHGRYDPRSWDWDS